MYDDGSEPGDELHSPKIGATFGLEEQPPISVTDSSHQGLDQNVPTDNGSMKVSSGLDSIRERKTTAVQNGPLAVASESVQSIASHTLCSVGLLHSISAIGK